MERLRVGRFCSLQHRAGKEKLKASEFCLQLAPRHEIVLQIRSVTHQSPVFWRPEHLALTSARLDSDLY